MYKYYVLVLYLIVRFNQKVVAQPDILRDAPKAQSFFKELKSQKVDSIIIYADGCIGCVVTTLEPVEQTKPTSYNCGCTFGHINIYFIWKSKGQHFIKRFDCCSSSETIILKIEPQPLFDYYKQHTSAWRKEKAFWSAYKKSNKGKNMKFLPPGPEHHSFNSLYFNGYSFTLRDYYFEGKLWSFLKWKDIQKNWTKLIEAYIHEYKPQLTVNN